MNKTFQIFATVILVVIILFIWLFSRIEFGDNQATSSKTKKTNQNKQVDYTKNFENEEDKKTLNEIIKKLPCKASNDLSKEINEILPTKKGQHNSFETATNNIIITLDDHTKYNLAHELGHGVDTIAINTNGIEINQSSLANEIKRNPEFDKIYHKELNQFFDAYEREKGRKHAWVKYKQEVNPTEIFATYYVLKIFGKSDTDFAKIMAKNMPETINKINELIKENRNLPEAKRRGFDKEFYPNGQIKSVKRVKKNVVYINGYHEDGRKAYQYQYFSDGTEHRFIDEYDENGNKIKTKFIKYGLDRVYTLPIN